VFKNHTKVARKKHRASQGFVIFSPSTTSIKNEIGNMLEDFKSKMMHTFMPQMDTMQIKIKKDESERALAIFYPRCTKKDSRNKCPLNIIEIYLVCEENNATDS